MKKYILIFLLVLSGCAPAYYTSVVYDLETTLACKDCPEGNPLMPNTKNRIALYSVASVWTVAFTVAVNKLKPKHKKLVYVGATAMRFFIGTMNLRYANLREEK